MWLMHVQRVLGQLIRPYWRLGLDGAVDAIPREGPLIVTCNHSSFLDPWFLFIPFPRGVHFIMTARWYNKSPLWRGFFKWSGGTPVGPQNARDAMGAVLRMLDRGWVVVLFPEGKISHDGRIQPFEKGVGHIAARSGALVLPVGIRGGFVSLPRTRRIPRPTRVRVHIGSPRRFPGAPVRGLPDRAEVDAFVQQLWNDVRRLAGQSGETP